MALEPTSRAAITTGVFVSVAILITVVSQTGGASSIYHDIVKAM
jgi:hypothetical protein